MVSGTRLRSKRSSPDTSPQQNPTKRAKDKKTGGQRNTTKDQKLNNPVNDTGSESEPKFPRAKLLSQYPQNPHCVITSAVFTVGNIGSDLVIRDGGLLCELKEMKESPSVATLEIKGTGVGPVKVNRKPYLKGTRVILKGGDEVVFNTPKKHAYIFQPLKYENLSAPEYRASPVTISKAHSKSHKDFLRARVLNPQDIEFSLENFPYFLSDATKDNLITSTKQSTICPRILLSGPAGSEIYRELLAKALAKHYGAKLMIVDTLFLPVESTSKDADSTKESDSRGSLTVLAEHAAPTSTTTSKSYTFKTGDQVKYAFSPCDLYDHLRHRGPKVGFKGKVILAFEDNESSKLGVIFDMPIADANDLGGLCEIDYGFFCAASSLRLDSSSNDDADKPAINEIFELVSNETENSSLILMLKDIGKSVSGNNELYFALKSKLENLPENTVVIASQTQLDSPEEKSEPGAFSSWSSKWGNSPMLNLLYPNHVPGGRLIQGKELVRRRSPKPVKRITKLFHNLVTINLPEDEAWLLGWKKTRT